MTRFKASLAAAAGALLLGAIGATGPSSAEAASAGAKKAATQQAPVAELVTDFVNAWNAHDGNALGRVFTPDGDFIGISGIQWHGPAEIAKVHSEQFSGRYGKSVFAMDGQPSIALLKPDVALIHWRWTLSDVLNPEGAPLAPYRGVFTWVTVRRDGAWRVRAAQNNVAKQ